MMTDEEARIYAVKQYFYDKKVVSMLLAFTLLAPGCASITPQLPHDNPADVGVGATVTKEMMTVENLLRWPLEGKAGVDKVAAGLKQMFELEEHVGSRLAGEGPVPLADGYILRSTSIGRGADRISVGVEGLPCFPRERAMKLTGAVQGLVRTDMHGGEYGKEYAVENYGIRLTFGTTPRTYQCVESIYIDRALKSNQRTNL